MFDTLRALWRLMHGSRLRYGLAIAMLVVASSFLYLVPLIPQSVIDGVLTEGGPEPSGMVRWWVSAMGGRDFVQARLWVPAVAMGGLAAVAGLFTYARERLSATAAESIVCRLRNRLYDHLQHLPCRFFDKAESGDLVQRCTSDIDTVRVFLSEQVVEMGRTVVMLIIPLPLMFSIDARMTGASLVLVPVIVGFSLLFFSKMHRAFKASDEAEAKLTATVQENISGIRVVRAFARQQFEIDRFSERNANYRKLDYGVFYLAGWFWATADFLCFAQQATVVGTGVVLLIMGQVSLGTLFFFLTVVSMFVFPMRQLGRLVSEFGKASVALSRLHEVLDTPAEQDPEQPTVPTRSEGRLVFRGVSFGFDPERPVLRDVSFTVEPHTTLAIVGPPGSGKSTIISLLLRMYDAAAGTISLDGVDVRTMAHHDLRARLAIVQQEPFLFSKTLGENLQMGRPGASQREVEQATEMARVHTSIARFEDGYETKVGERGVTLSGGQRQRVAIARALLQRPSVLVLDDALSAVDTETEAQILEALRARQGQHTTIVIAHRLSTLALADKVLVLERGAVVQQGSLEELRSQPGPFARVWSRSQQGTPSEETG